MNRRVWLGLLVIVALAAFLRLWDLRTVPPGLYPDEAMNGSNAAWALESGAWRIFYPENNGREGLFADIVALPVAVLGNEPWAVRLPSAFFGLATVAGMFFLARALFRNLAGEARFGFAPRDCIALSASFFTAVSFWHLNFSRIGFRAIMAPFFLVWAFALLWNALDSGAARRGISAAAGVLFGLGFYSYIAYRAAPILLIAPLLKIFRKRPWKPHLYHLGIFLAAAFVVALPIGVYFLAHPADFFGRTAQISVFSSNAPLRDFAGNLAKTFGMFWIRGDANPRHNLPGAAELWWPVGILLALGMIWSIAALVRRTRVLEHGFLWLWFGVFVLPVAFSSEGIPHALRSILMLPSVMIFAAYGLWNVMEWVYRWLDRSARAHPERRTQIRRISQEFGVLLVVFFAAHAVTTYTDYFWKWANEPATHDAFSERSVDIGRWLKTVPASVAKYVIVNASGVPVMPPDAVSGAPVSPMPMPAQTVMFLTDTWPIANRVGQNIAYLAPSEIPSIRCPGACAVVFLDPLSSEDGLEARRALQKSDTNFVLSVAPGFPVFYKGFSL